MTEALAARTRAELRLGRDGRRWAETRSVATSVAADRPRRREPVSPELVLVDPELAARERARLEERARLAEYRSRPWSPLAASTRDDVAGIRAAFEGIPDATTPLRGARVRGAAVSLTVVGVVAAAGVLVANRVGGGQRDATSLAQSPAPTGESPPVVPGARRGFKAPEPSSEQLRRRARRRGRAARTGTVPGRPRRQTTVKKIRTRAALGDRHAVERKILALLGTAPGSKFPKRLLDPATGLPKNNLQAICSRRTTVAFGCVVRPASHAPGEGLHLRYVIRPNGHGVFTWYAYSKGR